MSQRPPDDQFSVEGDVGIGEQPGDRAVGVAAGEIERCFHLSHLCAGTDHLGVRLRAQSERERLDQDALACAGFTGDHGEARLQIEFDPVGEREITQMQAGQQDGSPDANARTIRFLERMFILSEWPVSAVASYEGSAVF